jgi:hypothetical protein
MRRPHTQAGSEKTIQRSTYSIIYFLTVLYAALVGIVKNTIPKRRVHTIHEKLSPVILRTMKEIFENRVSEPKFAQSASPGPVSYRKVKALLLLENRPVLQIEAHSSAPIADSPAATFLEHFEALTTGRKPARKQDICPPSHWGLNE